MKLRVLVIDDDEDICLYLREFLTREGFKVTTISKPADALIEIRQGRYQIVLLDVRMPGVDGVDLLHPHAPFFKEFALTLPRPATDVRDALIERGFLLGFSPERAWPDGM